jgi:nucleoside-diphosphate-sugar epimerase
MATKMKDKKEVIFITGSEGFIGSHLTKHLEMLNIEYYSYDRNVHSSLDINDAVTLDNAVAAAKPTIIIHLAAVANVREAEAEPAKALRTNILGSFNVLTVADKRKIPVILASSAAAMEPQSSIYAMSKAAMETLGEMFPEATIARFYNIYGKRSKSVVNKFIYNMKRGRKLQLYGNTKRDYIHIEDLIHSIMRLIFAEKRPQRVTIGTGRSVSLQKLVSVIEKEMGKKAIIEQKPPRQEVQESRCTHPYGRYKITLEQGVRSLL